MKLYKNLNGDLFGFEIDGSQDHLIGDLIPITKNEAVKSIKQKELELISWEDIKSARNRLLKDSDWVDLPNSPTKNKTCWLKYRQDLRDIPQTFSTPQEVIWPQTP